MLRSMSGHQFEIRFGALALLLLGAVAAGEGCGQDSGYLQNPFDPAAGTATLVTSPGQLDASVPHLKLTMVDVGQGDGFVLELPSGVVVAVDGGPDRTGSYADFIAGLPRVDYVILSHPHSDHYTGLPNAIARLPDDCSARVFDPGYDRPDIGGYQYYKNAAGCRYRATGKGMSLSLDPMVATTVVGAADAPYPTTDGWGINNTSLVTHVRYGSFSIVLSGDAQTDAEQRVYADHMILRANVMKIGHHGSCNATGTTFLKSIAPDVALISAADNNDFGHPHCQTLAKLKAQGSAWYRTDTNGLVTVESDGQHFAVTTSKGKASDPTCPRPCGSPSDF